MSAPPATSATFLAGHGQKVVRDRKLGSPSADRSVQALLVAEHYAQEDAAALPAKPTRDRTGKPGSQSVAETAESVATPDQLPAVSRQHDVDAVPTEPGSLVEAVPGAVGKLRLRTHLEDAALRRCSAKRQLKLSRLVHREKAEPPDARRHLQIEPPSSRRPGHDDERSLRAPDWERRTLWSRRSRRAFPQHQPPTTSRQAIVPTARQDFATARSAARHASAASNGRRTRFASAMPTHSEASRECGGERSAVGITAPPGP
jgi:hypothetical protein